MNMIVIIIITLILINLVYTPLASTITGGNINGTASLFNFADNWLYYNLYWEKKEIITYSG